VNVVGVLAFQRDGDRGEIPKEAQHLVVGSVIRDEEAEVGVAQNRGDADEACTAAGNDADILPGVL
jgi:hypothetical protein